MKPFNEAWSILKALPEQQMFTEAPPRANAAEPHIDYDLPDTYPEIDASGAKSHGTVHPAIYGLLQRLVNEENQLPPDTLYPDLNLDSKEPSANIQRVVGAGSGYDAGKYNAGDGRFFNTHPTQEEEEWRKQLEERVKQRKQEIERPFPTFENKKHPTLGPFEESAPFHKIAKEDAFAELRALIAQKKAEREQAERELEQQRQQMSGSTAVTPLQPAVGEEE